MGTGIIVCGLNGTGKSTLGKALAEELGHHFIGVLNEKVRKGEILFTGSSLMEQFPIDELSRPIRISSSPL